MTVYHGIPLLKAWMHNVLRCRREAQKINRTTGTALTDRQGRPRNDCMDHAAEAVALAYREHADARTLTAFIGRDKLEWFTGIGDRNAREYRAVLVRFGWLADTGERRGNGRKRSVVYRLEIPQCDCGRHDSWVMAGGSASERIQRAAAVVQGHAPGDGTRPAPDDDIVSVGNDYPRGNVDDDHRSVGNHHASVGSDHRNVGSDYAANSRVVQTSPTDESVQTNDVDRRARERDSAPAVRPGYVAPLAGPRTNDDHNDDPIGAAVIGWGAADATQHDDTTEAEPMEWCGECGALSDAPVCVDCDLPPEEYPAGMGLPAEHGGTPGGHDPALPAPAAALLAALRAYSPLPLTKARDTLERAGASLSNGLVPLMDHRLAHTRGTMVHLGPEVPDDEMAA
ncbi:hypothetical protein GCM10009613_11590 [Pseudonocardia kongjuensis]|uniref:Helix-turn-helix protein n=1 Tax=Pseudonocardia kongjuensis TaxID=102227 RepID=A0ABN1XLE3_9PSEU